MFNFEFETKRNVLFSVSVVFFYYLLLLFFWVFRQRNKMTDEKRRDTFIRVEQRRFVSTVVLVRRFLLTDEHFSIRSCAR
jgi:hypothetical protein